MQKQVHIDACSKNQKESARHGETIWNFNIQSTICQVIFKKYSLGLSTKSIRPYSEKKINTHSDALMLSWKRHRTHLLQRHPFH